MTSVIDSEAQFNTRLLELGLPAQTVTAIQNHGVRTLSQLAFAVGQPGQPLVDGTINNFLTAALTRAGTLAETTGLKRAAFEAQTYLVATLRQNVERPADEQPRKIAYAERTTRMATLRANLAGVAIDGELEPSHGLLDRACALYESNSLKFLDLATCVSRTQEVQGTTKAKELTLEKGSLVLKSGQDSLQCSTDSEIKVHYAMVRRGLACQFARNYVACSTCHMGKLAL